jgi:hypothetical protein
MDTTRRSFVASSVLLFAGCTGADPGGSESTPTETTEPSTNTSTESDALECNPERVEDKTGRTEYAVGVYEQAYDDLRNGQEAIGAMMDSEGLYINREEGADANVPDGLIIDREDGGDVILTLVDYSGSPLSEMRNSQFYDALEGFRDAQGILETNIEGDDSTVLQRRNPDGWEYAENFVSGCSIENGDLFHEPIENGMSTAEHLIAAAEKFAEECTVYIDNDAEFEDDVPEATEIQQEAVSELQSAANDYPRTPDSLENEVLVYRGE